jgi:predicted Zn-dependent protease
MPKTKELSFEVAFFEDLYGRLPKDFRVVSILAHLYTQTGRYDCGLKLDRKLVRMVPEDPVLHYNLACSLALKDRKRDAVNTLQRAVDLGYRDFVWMREDPDLESLQDFPPFLNLLEANAESGMKH